MRWRKGRGGLALESYKGEEVGEGERERRQNSIPEQHTYIHIVSRSLDMHAGLLISAPLRNIFNHYNLLSLNSKCLLLQSVERCRFSALSLNGK